MWQYCLLSPHFSGLFSPCAEEHPPLDFVSFLNVQRNICILPDFWPPDFCAVLFYLQAEKNPGSLVLFRALASTCADNLGKEWTFPKHTDILKLMNVKSCNPWVTGVANLASRASIGETMALSD